MGQQQLLLLVLGIVIVGLAVVVGIQAFGENQKKANADAITNDVIRIASDAQAWALKPGAFGGGDGDFLQGTGSTEVTLAGLGYEVTGTTYTNLNGSYQFTGTTTANSLVVQGCSLTRKNTVTATITGTGPGNITTTVANNDGTAC